MRGRWNVVEVEPGRARLAQSQAITHSRLLLFAERPEAQLTLDSLNWVRQSLHFGNHVAQRAEAMSAQIRSQ
eukprot:233712-Prymnesium_polylepis.1